jgi:hypothetical protein
MRSSESIAQSPFLGNAFEARYYIIFALLMYQIWVCRQASIGGMPLLAQLLMERRALHCST